MADEIIFTPIPKFITGDLLVFSVYTTFRLSDHPTLASYPDLLDWPDRELSFQIRVGDQTFNAQPHGPFFEGRDLAWWQSLFPSSTVVGERDEIENNGTSRFRSFSAKSIADAVKNAHFKLATKFPIDLPPATEVIKTFNYLSYPDISVRETALEAVEEAIRIAGTSRFSNTQLTNAISSVSQVTAKKRSKGNEAEMAATLTGLRNLLSKRLTDDRGKAFMIAEAFRDHRFVDATPTKTVPVTEVLDFHERLSALNPHPYLLWKLGIVRDYSVDLSDAEGLTGKLLTECEVAGATWTGKTTSTDSFIVMTNLDRTNGVFRAATRQDVLDARQDGLKSIGGTTALARRLKDGYINLSDPRWELVTVNVEEAALKMSGLATDISRFEGPDPVQLDKGAALANKAGGGDVMQGATSASLAASTGTTFDPSKPLQGSHTPVPKVLPPSLRSTGIYLVRDGIESELRWDLSHLHNVEVRRRTGKPPYVCAEDITRGYAIDVYDEDEEKWFSLCQRIGTYHIGAQSKQAGDAGEAAVIPSLAGLNGGLDDFVMHPALVCWSGWSLAAPLPGKLIAATGSVVGVPGQPLVDQPTQTPAGFPLRAVYKPSPGSIPRLRFGREYRMRARAIDIAGNVIPLAEARDDDAVTIGPVKYGRYDPISPPHLMLRSLTAPPPSADAILKEAESVGRMVVRSNHDFAPTLSEIPERMVVPPRTSWSLAETHGAFDVTNVLDGEVSLGTQAYSRFADPAYSPATEPHKEGASGPVGEKDPVIVDPITAPYKVPYLPEASTRTVRFVGLPGTDQHFDIDMYEEANWPYVRTFLIKVIEGDGPPELQVEPHAGLARKVLVVQVPKGRAFTVRYSSVPLRPEESALYVLSEDSALELAALQTFRNHLNGGRVQLYSPKRDLILVHAVLQPNEVPSYEWAWDRRVGDTFATLLGKVTVDRPSTGRVHLRANWTEFHDSAPSGPTTAEGRALVADVAVGFVEAPKGYDPTAVDLSKPEVSTGAGPRAVQHEFDDTKHRRVEYTPVATSRFLEYFPKAHAKNSTAASTSIGTHVDPDSVIVRRASDTSVVFERGPDYTLSEVSGEWFVSKVPLGGIGPTENIAIFWKKSRVRVGDPVTTHIKSSARPAAPKVAFITPAFRWEPETPASINESDDTTESFRKGRILRVWLERPWYSSGEDEKLGVLVIPSGAVLPSQLKALDRFVTQFASDPIYKAAGLQSRYARTANFPKTRLPLEDTWGIAVSQRSGVSLAERPTGSKPTVMGYNVAFDEESKRWYSDISIDMLSNTAFGPDDTHYFPFVRLALVRYQPHSLDGCHISPVSLADFVQLTPDRSATVVRTGNQLEVIVSGYTHVDGPGPEVGATRVTAQMQINVDDNPDFEWSNLGSEVVLDPSASALRPYHRTWRGSLDLPNANARVLIREYEVYEALGDQVFGGPNGQLPSQLRLVYMDILNVF